jgi:hypothetical protein
VAATGRKVSAQLSRIRESLSLPHHDARRNSQLVEMVAWVYRRANGPIRNCTVEVIGPKPAQRPQSMTRERRDSWRARTLPRLPISCNQIGRSACQGLEMSEDLRSLYQTRVRAALVPDPRPRDASRTESMATNLGKSVLLVRGLAQAHHQRAGRVWFGCSAKYSNFPASPTLYLGRV